MKISFVLKEVVSKQIILLSTWLVDDANFAFVSSEVTCNWCDRGKQTLLAFEAILSDLQYFFFQMVQG